MREYLLGALPYVVVLLLLVTWPLALLGVTILGIVLWVVVPTLIPARGRCATPAAYLQPLGDASLADRVCTFFYPGLGASAALHGPVGTARVRAALRGRPARAAAGAHSPGCTMCARLTRPKSSQTRWARCFGHTRYRSPTLHARRIASSWATTSTPSHGRAPASPSATTWRRSWRPSARSWTRNCGPSASSSWPGRAAARPPCSARWPA